MEMDYLLERIKHNSAVQATLHKKRYVILKSRLKWYRLPVIAISAINSVLAIGLQTWIDQTTISALNSGLALLCGVVGSVELYLQINRQMESHLISTKDFYVLSTDIYKYLSIAALNRTMPEPVFLEEAYNRYVKLVQSSLLLKKHMDDKLTGKITIRPNAVLRSLSVESLTSHNNDASSIGSDDSA